MSPLRFRRLDLPTDLALPTVVRLLERLTSQGSPRPLVFETERSGDAFGYRVGYADEQTGSVERLLADYLPGARLGRSVERELPDSSSRVVLRGRNLPLRTDEPEALVHALHAALSAAHGDERLTLQVVIGPGYRPAVVPASAPAPDQTMWQAIIGVNTTARPEQRRQLARHAAEPGLGLLIRIGAAAGTSGRREALLRGVAGAIALADGPSTRLELIPEDPRRLRDAREPRWWTTRLTATELAPLLTWPIGDSELPGLGPRHPRRPPAPEGVPEKENAIGVSTAPGNSRPIGIPQAARLQHLVITGPTGSGKSVLLAEMARHDILARRPIVLIDPKRQLVDHLLERLPDSSVGRVVVLDGTESRPVGFNPLDTSGRDADVVVDGILSVFRDVFADGWGPRTEDLLHAGLLSLARSGSTRAEPYTLLDLPRLLTDTTFRRSVVGSLRGDTVLASFWAGFEELSPANRGQIIAAPMNKLRKYLLRPGLARVLGQPRPPLHLRDVFQEDKAVLVPLNSSLLGPGAAELLGSLVVAELWLAVQERAIEADPMSRPGFIYIDEVQRFLHLPTSIADALATSRSYGVGWHMALQHRGQAPAELRSAFDVNARTKIAFASELDDARDYARMDARSGLEAVDFQALDRYEVYLRTLVAGRPTSWFSLRVSPPSPTLGAAEAIRQASRNRFGGDLPGADGPTREASSTASELPTHRKARRS